MGTVGRFLVVALVTSPLQPATSQDRWTEQVINQLVESARDAGHAGMELSHQPYTGALNGGRYETLTLRFQEGSTYAVVGACDADCSDLDLRLYDEDGNLIDSDMNPDDRPIVAVQPAWTGGFRVRVIMASCHSPPCRYGVGVFKK